MDRLWTPWRYNYIAGDRSGTAGDAAADTAPDPRPGVPHALRAWPDAGTRCVFCNIVAAVAWAETAGGMSTEQAERAALVLERGPHSFMLLNAYPYTSGHLMAVPNEHNASLAALPAATAAALLHDTRRAERALRAVYRPGGLNVGINMGEAAGAGVAEHLHVHALPRWGGDANFMTVVGETRILPELLEVSWQRLRTALNETAEPVESA